MTHYPGKNETKSEKKCKTQRALSTIDAITAKQEEKQTQASFSSKMESNISIHPQNCHRQSIKSLNVESHCHCKVSIFMSPANGYYYLDSKHSNLWHNDHSYIPL
jgi:hypothetical protein